MRPHNRFDMIHEIIEGDERKLSFEVRIFAQMAASVTLSGMSARDLVISEQFYLFSALKLSCTQNTSPNEGRQVSRYSCEL